MDYCDECVCLSVCVCLSASYLRNYMSSLHQIFVHVTCGLCSLLLWCHYNTLCTKFGVMDDVVFELIGQAYMTQKSIHLT